MYTENISSKLQHRSIHVLDNIHSGKMHTRDMNIVFLAASAVKINKSLSVRFFDRKF